MTIKHHSRYVAPGKAEKRSKVTVRLPSSLAKRVAEKAAARGMTINDYVLAHLEAKAPR